MANLKEHLDKYLGEGKIPLKNEIFARKEMVGAELQKYREEKRAKALVKRLRVIEKNRVTHRRYVNWRIAALFVLLFGVGGGYFFSEKKITSESVAISCKLPDGSWVRLMENSSIEYNRLSWFWERKLNLLGKAYFNVTSGKEFTVKTEAGDITVLGTRFLVEQKGKTMTVNCEEGHIKVETPIGERTLTAGESVRCDEKVIEIIEEKEELPEMLGYEEDPLVNVVADIEHIFNVKVIGCEKYEGLYYSGTIMTRDLEGTLKRVFGSLKIAYQINGKEVLLD